MISTNRGLKLQRLVMLTGYLEECGRFVLPNDVVAHL